MDVIRHAKTLGFEVIEFSGLSLPAGETPSSYAPKIRDACARESIAMGNYTIGADFLNGSGGDWQAEAGRLKEEVRIAALLGAPGIRHDATRGFPQGHAGPKGFDDALPVLVKGCRTVAEFAAGLGIRTMVENHGFFCQDSERVEKLVNGVAHPNFGILLDMGNFACVDENPASAAGRLAPYTFHVHAKDFFIKSGMEPDPGKGWFVSRGGNYLRGTIIGHGEVPVLSCLRILKRAGYDGTFSIEFEGIEDPMEGIAIGLVNLRRYLSQSGW
jgi:sugar phosphate isomerase/epimerase